MANQQKCIFIILQECGQPADMTFIQIVGRFVKNKNSRVFQKQFCQQNLCSLTTGKPVYISVQAKFTQAKAIGKFFNTAVNGVKTAVVQNVLDFAHVFHQLCHFFVRTVCHSVVHIQHIFFQLIHMAEGCAQYIADGHTGFQHRMLIQIAYCGAFCPGNCAFIRLCYTCDNVKEGGFALAIGANKADMLPFFHSERSIIENLSFSKAVAYILYIKHLYLSFRFQS